MSQSTLLEGNRLRQNIEQQNSFTDTEEILKIMSYH